jgi:hypothetical protein
MGTILQFGGVYRSGHLFLRFYPDGTVLETAAPPRTPADQMKGWLTPALSMVSKGKWRLERGRLRFSVLARSIGIDYRGKIENGGLALRWKSSNENGRSRYRFLRFSKGGTST